MTNQPEPATRPGARTEPGARTNQPEPGTRPGAVTTGRLGPADPVLRELALHVAASTGLPEATAARVVADVTAYFGETVEEFVRRRHEELKRRQWKNDEIWPAIGAELATRRFASPELSDRQLRRIVYG